MYGYDVKELKDFLIEQLADYTLSVDTIAQRGDILPGYLGQGISRTTLSFYRYPDIVFKICVGTDSEISFQEGETEKERWFSAIEEGVAPYFAQTEYLCDIEMFCDEWINDEDDGYGHYEIDCHHTCEVPVYIQSRVDEIWCESEINRSLYSSKNSLIKEKKIFESLEDCWISDVDNDRLFSALFIRKYGIEEYKKLAQFIVNYGIEDLHGANWGIKDGDLVIIDYAM